MSKEVSGVLKTHYDEINKIWVRGDRHRKEINEMDVDIKKVLKRLDKLERKVKEQAEVIQQLDKMVDHHSETIMKIPGCCCAKGDKCSCWFWQQLIVFHRARDD